MHRKEAAEPVNLVIGGTGMLSGVALALSTEFRTIVVARGIRRLHQVYRKAKAGGGTISAVPMDYSRPGEADRMPDLLRHWNVDCRKVVIWVHSHAEVFSTKLLAYLGKHNPDAVVVHVLGSASLQREGIADRMLTTDFVDRLPNYRQAVLGFKREGDGARWLTHEEICAGVMHALDMAERRYVVGTVEPWNLRPGA